MIVLCAFFNADCSEATVGSVKKSLSDRISGYYAMVDVVES